MTPIVALPKAVLMDLDDTIYSYDECHKSAEAEVIRNIELRLQVSESDFLVALSSAKKAVKTRLGNTAASHSRLLYFKTALAILGFSSDFDYPLELEEVYWSKFLTKMKKFEGVDEFLDLLESRSIPVAIVTDLTTQIQLRKLKNLGLQNRVSVVITSEEAGSEKPDQAPFLLAMDGLGVQAGSTWMIGDSLVKDIAGAKSFPGMISIQRVVQGSYSEAKAPSPDVTFTYYEELIQMIKSIPLEGQRIV